MFFGTLLKCWARKVIRYMILKNIRSLLIINMNYQNSHDTSYLIYHMYDCHTKNHQVNDYHKYEYELCLSCVALYYCVGLYYHDYHKYELCLSCVALYYCVLRGPVIFRTYSTWQQVHVDLNMIIINMNYAFLARPCTFAWPCLLSMPEVSNIRVSIRFGTTSLLLFSDVSIFN